MAAGNSEAARLVAELTRPVWIEIDRRALIANARRLKEAVGGEKIIAVVKANAYGHGADIVAPALAPHVDFFGVASLAEAEALIAARVAKPVLVMGYTPPRFAPELARQKLRQTVFSLDYARQIDRQLSPGQTPLLVHVKVDTGMGRLGIPYPEAASSLREISRLKHIKVEGICTHLASADEDEELTALQIKRFDRVLKASKQGAFVHAAGSAGAFVVPRGKYHGVRFGIMLYGYSPFAPGFAPQQSPPPLEPVLSLKARLISVKRVPAGQTVSYGATFRTHRPSTLGVLPAGYGDGVSRHLSNKAKVLIRGRRAPVVGRVCMDFTVVDMTGVAGAKVGDEVVLIGKQGGEVVTAAEWATLCQTIPYEILTGLSARLPRVPIG